MSAKEGEMLVGLAYDFKLPEGFHVGAAEHYYSGGRPRKQTG